MGRITLSDRTRNSQTKIVATVGPASNTLERLVELIEAGVDVFRINTAHGDKEQHAKRIADIRAASQKTGRVAAILLDLAGPKMRLGELPSGQIDCSVGMRLRFVRGNSSSQPNELTTTYEPLIDELKIGDRVMLADGTVGLEVIAEDNESATCKVFQQGIVRSRQGINLPGVKLSVPTLGERDRDFAKWGIEQGVDFLSLSFVRSPDDIKQLREIVESAQSTAHVIAKIEKPEAIEHLESIVEATDGVMVARGDLGVEIDIADVPVIQKHIIATCRRHAKPVIVATQMLDSMQDSTLPTRAEATDVANAILDGADACMLSGETAIGQFPVESVKMMHRIASATEPQLRWLARESGASTAAIPNVPPITDATTYGAGRIAEKLDAEMLIVASASGRSAKTISSRRLLVPTIGVSDSDVVLRRMCLFWGVTPLSDAPTDDAAKLMDHVVQLGQQEGLLKEGDRIVMIAGTGLKVTRHNLIQVHQL